MSGFTPGPWHVDPRTDGRSRGYIRCATKAGGPNGIAVAQATYTGRGLEEARANAVLIAAAPDLHAALQHALAELDGIVHATTGIREVGDAIVHARAALAKAKL